MYLIFVDEMMLSTADLSNAFDFVAEIEVGNTIFVTTESTGRVAYVVTGIEDNGTFSARAKGQRKDRCFIFTADAWLLSLAGSNSVWVTTLEVARPLPAPTITNVDVCDTDNDLCERYTVPCMTVSDFNTMVDVLSARMSGRSYYCKVRFTLDYIDADGDEHTASLRWDITGEESGHTLADFMLQPVEFFRGPDGDRYAARMFTPSITGEQAAQVYEERARIVAAAA